MELLLLRGEKLNALYSEVDELKEMTVTFKRSSGELERSFFRRNLKYFIISGILIIVIIVIIIIICTIS